MKLNHSRKMSSFFKSKFKPSTRQVEKPSVPSFNEIRTEASSGVSLLNPGYSRSSNNITLPKPIGSLRRSSSLERPNPQVKKVLASTIPPVVGTVFQRTFENMEQKMTVQFVGVLERIYQNKDVWVTLFEENLQPTEDMVHDSDCEQLVTAGVEKEVIPELTNLPAGISFPVKFFDGQFKLRFKVTDPTLLKPLRDPESEYGYMTNVLVRITATTASWNGWRGNDAGVIFYVKSIELLEMLPELEAK